MLFVQYPIKVSKKGELGTKKFTIFYKKNGKLVSPWHDIPLYNSKDDTYNMICEIPKWTRRKMEINTKLKNNPIKQDIRNNKLREYVWGDMLFNYGALPQTWEDPNHKSIDTDKFGDNDPLDIIDIGETQAKMGSIYKVKVLGILGLIDQNETDWKVIGINICDPNFDNINNLTDIKKFKPNVLQSIKYWLENYKVPLGERKNKFAFDGKYKSKFYAKKIIDECHKMWKNKFLVFSKI